MLEVRNYSGSWSDSSEYQRATYLNDFPTPKQMLTGFQKYANPPEIDMIFEWFSHKSENYLCATLFGYNCGLGIAEAVKVNEQDIDKENRILNVHREKTGVHYTVGIPKEFFLWLTEYYIPKYQEFMQDGYLIFVVNDYALKKHHKHIGKNTIQTEFARLRNHFHLRDQYSKGRNGKTLHRITFHTLRHHYAETADAAGVSLQKISVSLGHRNIRHTLTYIRAFRTRHEQAAVADAISAKLQAIKLPRLTKHSCS